MVDNADFQVFYLVIGRKRKQQHLKNGHHQDERQHGFVPENLQEFFLNEVKNGTHI
jgi:hypothetical protein